jgi:hypothetical protein
MAPTVNPAGILKSPESGEETHMTLAHAPKLLVKPLLVLAAVLGAILVSAVPASASADGCVWSESTPISCVRVVGSSTYVNSATGGVNLGARQSARGSFHTYDTSRKFNVQTQEYTYWNQSWWHRQTFWGPTRTLNRYLPNNDQVCSSFWERRGNHVIRHSPACITIVR